MKCLRCNKHCRSQLDSVTICGVVALLLFPLIWKGTLTCVARLTNFWRSYMHHMTIWLKEDLMIVFQSTAAVEWIASWIVIADMFIGGIVHCANDGVVNQQHK